MTNSMPALEVRDLVYSYSRPEVSQDGELDSFELRVASLQILAGEQVALTAGSGRGKSTLLGLIAGLIDPKSGTIEVGGQKIHSLQGAARDAFRGRKIGMVFQTFNLLHGFSAMENVLAAIMISGAEVTGSPQERAKQLLAELGIQRVHAPVDQLSVGQQQRVAVARAVACRPSLVLADEPTASLDPENAVTALDLIRRMARESGAALLCVSHDPAVINSFERRESLDALAAK